MAATTAGALKALIEAGGLSLSAYRDEAPDDTTLPYVTITERIALVPNGVDGRYDRSSSSGPHTGNETVQVSLWEQWRHPTTKALTESYTLSDALVRLLDGAALATAPTHVWGVRFLSSRRLPPELESNLVQTALTLVVVRDV
jgi:hypothetical protein